ncbi:MAG: helix-turn-helix domain-containing protein [Candidatus Roizmanbacteria bacterium]|nr:MAG: helix-turn-helix domain-containing protein [Candidatus Roizmanbacteria bacterium]
MASVGEIIKKEREKKGLTLRQIEKEIKIREKYLAAIEENKWEIFSSRIYIIGVIKNYSKVLGLESQKIVALFRRDYEQKDDIHFKRRVASHYLTSQSRRIVLGGVILIIAVFSSYFGYQLKQFLSPPKVAIVSPQGDRFRSVDILKITGQTEKEASIIIYGEKIYPSKDGTFQYDFPIKMGRNELVIEVIGANGKKAVLKKDYFKD